MSLPPLRLAIVPAAVGLLLGGAIAVHRQIGRSPAPDPAAAGTTAANGGLVVSTERLDFGAMELGRAVSRPLLLRNGGSDPIHVNIESEGSGWTVEPAELTLAPGGIERVQVTGTRLDSGVPAGQIRIFTDRSSEAAAVVALASGARSDADDVLMAESGDDDRSSDGSAGRRDGSGFRADGGVPAPNRPGAFSIQGNPASGTQGPVFIARNQAESPANGTDPASDGNGGLTAGAAPGNSPIVPFDAATARAPRSISERPATVPREHPAREGEEPVPVNPPLDPGEGSDSSGEPSSVSESVFAISSASSVRLLGTSNKFYAQQVRISGSAGGGSFRLGSALQVPRIPLAFGQSMAFSQSGSAVGSYNAASGQVTIDLPVAAVDSNGNSAPVVFSMTTGTIVTRNPNGVLVSVTGQPRSPESGELRLVGLAKIPTGFRNGAEEQLVTLDVVGSLTFAAPASARAASDAASTGVQENL